MTIQKAIIIVAVIAVALVGYNMWQGKAASLNAGA